MSQYKFRPATKKEADQLDRLLGNRICSNCGTKNTYKNPSNGNIEWHRRREKLYGKSDLWLCKKCYLSLYYQSIPIVGNVP